MFIKFDFPHSRIQFADEPECATDSIHQSIMLADPSSIRTGRLSRESGEETGTESESRQSSAYTVTKVAELLCSLQG